MQLSSIKAVDDSYPIIGELELKTHQKFTPQPKILRKVRYVWMKD